MSQPRIAPLLVALTAGSVVGWLDTGASEVQGTLLLLMVAAFAIALVSRAPAWMIAVAVGAGLPLAHLVSQAMGMSGTPQVAMLIVILPLAIASFAGRGVATMLADASATIENDSSTGRAPLSAEQLLGAALIACALLGFVPVYATLQARQQPNAWWVAIIWQVVSFVAWSAAAPLVFRLWRSMRGENARGVSSTELIRHAALVVMVAAAHAMALTGLTLVLHVPLGGHAMTAIIWGYAAYLPTDALTYALIMILAHAYDASRQLRVAADREAAVRGELATSRLASLQAQLRPHFLFNALNAASVLAKRGDALRASNVLAKLSELLRYVLRGAESDDGVQKVRLSEEMAFAQAYLKIEQERFGDRLRPSIDIDTETRGALIPHLVLQPLVENAIHHGVDAKLNAGEIRITARRAGNELTITVDDDGPGVDAVTGKGIGLSNTKSRLATLFGDRARLDLSRRPEGGTRATIIMPWDS